MITITDSNYLFYIAGIIVVGIIIEIIYLMRNKFLFKNNKTTIEHKIPTNKTENDPSMSWKFTESSTQASSSDTANNEIPKDAVEKGSVLYENNEPIEKLDMAGLEKMVNEIDFKIYKKAHKTTAYELSHAQSSLMEEKKIAAEKAKRTMTRT